MLFNISNIEIQKINFIYDLNCFVNSFSDNLERKRCRAYYLGDCRFPQSIGFKIRIRKKVY